jgi:hypothetical protein
MERSFRQKTFVLWYDNWKAKHEFSALTAEFVEIRIRNFFGNRGEFRYVRDESKEELWMVVVAEQVLSRQSGKKRQALHVFISR